MEESERAGRKIEPFVYPGESYILEHSERLTPNPDNVDDNAANVDEDEAIT